MNQRDAQLRLLLDLPNGANTTTSASLNLGPLGQLDSRGGDTEFPLTVPSLTTGVLADAATMKYDILGSSSADLSSPVVLLGSNTAKLTQTGAGGAGAGGTTLRFRPASNWPQFIGFRAANSGTGNASAASALLKMLF